MSASTSVKKTGRKEKDDTTDTHEAERKNNNMYIKMSGAAKSTQIRRELSVCCVRGGTKRWPAEATRRIYVFTSLESERITNSQRKRLSLASVSRV